MTKAKTTTRPATKGAGPETGAKSPETKVKRQPAKATPVGAATIASSMETAPSAPGSATSSPTPKPHRQTKAALLRARLAEPGGVSLAALIEATGWQAHTLRAAFSGLRKEGLTLTRRRDGEDTIYAIEPGEPVVAGVADGSASEVPAGSAVDAAAATPEGSVSAAEAPSAALSLGSDA